MRPLKKAPVREERYFVAGKADTGSGVAGRYATALFELALEEKALEEMKADGTLDDIEQQWLADKTNAPVLD